MSKLIKINTVRADYFNGGDDVKFEKNDTIIINADKIIKIFPYASAWEIKMEGDVMPEDGYQHHFTLISDEEYQRINALLIGDTPAPTPTVGVRGLLAQLKIMHDNMPMTHRVGVNTAVNTAWFEHLTNIMLDLIDCYNASETSLAPVPTLPAVHVDDNREWHQTFRNLLAEYADARTKLIETPIQSNHAITTECYQALMAHARVYNAPALPADVVAAYRKFYRITMRRGAARTTEAFNTLYPEMEEARREVIDAVGSHISDPLGDEDTPALKNE
jgi:hypothetical protein